MSPASFFVLTAAWLIMFWCNCLMPPVSDDYMYSYIIGKDSVFHNFVVENAVRVGSFSNILVSQWNHYMLWGGRTVAHFIDQFFLWQGELIFDIANASAFILLIVEICWIVDRGRVSLDLKPGRLIWIFFAFWMFTINFVITFLWTTGACNYLWTAVILLGFLLPYVRQWFVDRPLEIKPIAMLSAGVIAGWTNENTVCWFIIAIALMCRRLRAEGRMRRWMIAGLIGLSIGYALMIFAPGNFARIVTDLGGARAIIFEDAFTAIFLLGLGVFYPIMIWYFFLRTLMNQKAFGDDIDVRRSLIAAKTFAAISLLSNLIMVLSPVFTARSLFPSLVFLIIAATILIRLQHETRRNTLDLSLRIFLHSVGGIVFTLSLCASIMCGSIQWNYYRKVERLLEREHALGSKKILLVEDFQYPRWLEKLAVSHTMSNFLGVDGGKYVWNNKAFAHYYGAYDIALKKFQ